MIAHPQIDQILERILQLREEGKTVPQISHQIAREFETPRGSLRGREVKRSWESRHTIECLEILRSQGLLREEGRLLSYGIGIQHHQRIMTAQKYREGGKGWKPSNQATPQELTPKDHDPYNS